MEEKEKDLVNYPPHYRFNGFELLDVLKAKLDKSNMTLYQASLWTQCVQYMFRFDAKGNPLKKEFRKTFLVTGPDRTSPKIEAWKLTLPLAKTTQPLKVRFKEPLDYALCHRIVRILDEKGHKIKGKVRLAQDETLWIFEPTNSWNPGRYVLEADGVLEDLAGNSLEKPFEVELGKPNKISASKTFRRIFQISEPK